MIAPIRTLSLILALPFALAALPVMAQTAPAQTKPVQQQPVTPPKPAAPTPKPGDLKKYDEVVTKEAQTQQGLFKVHRIDDKILWEIPASLVGRLFLWQTEISELPQSLGYPGTAVGVRTVRFTRRNNHLFLRNAEFAVRAAAEGATTTGVEANSIEPIIAVFDIQTEGEGKAPVIDVTSLFTSDPQDFSVKSAIGAAGVDSSRSYVQRVKSFPTNVETRSQLTMMLGGRRFSPFGGFGGPEASSATIVVHYSLDLLPEKPMMGRLKDSRIGYFTTDFTEYGRPENRSVERRYINRFRLEKKDPTAAVSEPVQPIVFYLAREVPEKWRPYLKKAIEDWQPAFELAGFKNAIIAKDAPSVKEDPFWDAEDARYSVIRWAPSTVENAMGPSIQDPRSGETLSAHVIVWNDVIRLVEDWYFSQCAAIDPQARHLPLPDDLVGKLLRYVVAHEVGHTLGLEHNFRGSVAYSIAELRDPKFTDQYGVASSIMSYSRYNYVAQPGDGVKQNWGMVGPYDKFAIEYGYKQIPGAANPDDEKPALDIFLAKQVRDKTVRFGNYLYYGIDPTTQSELISDDSIEAGRLGLLNLDRIAKNYLLPATTKYGEDYQLLDEMHSQLMSQRFTELLHIVPLVGGEIETDYHVGHGDEVFAPVPFARQRKAVQFLVNRGFETPPALFDRHILNLIQPTGAVSRATTYQMIVLTSLLSESRMQRMQEAQALYGKPAYSIGELVSEVTQGVWSEVDAKEPVSTVYRRVLQRSYLKTIDGKINGANASKTDLKPMAIAELKRLAARIDKAIPKTKDTETAAHLLASRSDIEKILQGKFSTGSSSGSIYDFLYGLNSNNPTACWAENKTLIEAIRDASR